MRLTKQTKILFLLSGITVLINFTYIIIKYNTLPDMIPLHFDSLGTPSNYQRKIFVFIVPCITLLFVLMGWLLVKRPKLINLTRVNKLTEVQLAKSQKSVSLIIFFLSVYLCISAFLNY